MGDIATQVVIPTYIFDFILTWVYYTYIPVVINIFMQEYVHQMTTMLATGEETAIELPEEIDEYTGDEQ